MILTKRYEYMPFDRIKLHPDIGNHRVLNSEKALHYERDILQNGLLEPLMVWEKNTNEHYLIGGFHRMVAIHAIRKKHPGYFDRVDVRVVNGDLDEMKALNLKLNADRVEAKITDFFQVVTDLKKANWPTEKIAEFLDRSPTWIEEIIRYAPSMPMEIRKLLEEGKISWNRARECCRTILNAPAGKEKEAVERELKKVNGSNGSSETSRKRYLTFTSAKKRLAASLKTPSKPTFSVSTDDLLSLILLLEGKHYTEDDISKVRQKIPILLDGHSKARG
jgi:ParB family transcriptional regulator, chromosome partitioning protein